jgi:methionyl aminopeptidase
MVILKTKKELDKMRDSGYIASRVLKKIEQEAKPGITTIELNTIAEKTIRNYGGIPAFLGYNNFPFTICASINEEIIHGLPSDRVLLEGDILSVDVGVIYKGYYSDTAITIPVGKVSSRARKIINTTKKCLRNAIIKSIPNTPIGCLSSSVQKCAESRGFNVVRNYGGHGVGRELHEDPQILNYGNAGTGIMLKVGMVIAIEPILTENSSVNIKRGGWTVITKDGGLSAHFEHTVAITEDGPEILTERS